MSQFNARTLGIYHVRTRRAPSSTFTLAASPLSTALAGRAVRRAARGSPSSAVPVAQALWVWHQVASFQAWFFALLWVVLYTVICANRIYKSWGHHTARGGHTRMTHAHTLGTHCGYANTPTHNKTPRHANGAGARRACARHVQARREGTMRRHAAKARREGTKRIALGSPRPSRK